MKNNSCSRCGRELAPGDERHVPAFIAETTAFAFAFFHGGMWAKETLGKPFCSRCARVVAGISVLACAAVLAAATTGLALWLTRGLSRQ
jgi:ribosomal protein S27AE